MTQAYDACMELARVLHRSAELCTDNQSLAAGLRVAGLMAQQKAAEAGVIPDWVTVMTSRHTPTHHNKNVQCRTCGTEWPCDAARLLSWVTT